MMRIGANGGSGGATPTPSNNPPLFIPPPKTIAAPATSPSATPATTTYAYTPSGMPARNSLTTITATAPLTNPLPSTLPATKPGTYSATTHAAINTAINTDNSAGQLFNKQMTGVRALNSTTRAAFLQDRQIDHQASTAAWKTAQAYITNDFKAQGDGVLAPDKVVQPTVKSLNALASPITHPGLANAVSGAFQNAMQGWTVQGTTTGELNKLGQQITSATATKDWSQVGARVMNILNGGLLHGNQPPGKLPEDTATSLQAQLNERFGNAAFHQVNGLAMNATRQNLATFGLSNAQFAGTKTAYQSFTDAQSHYDTYLQQHGLPPDSNSARAGSAQGILLARVQAAWGNTSDAIQSQIQAAMDSHKNLIPQQRAMVLNDVTAMIGHTGPQEADFAGATLNADLTLRVAKPAQAVQNAYLDGSNPTQGSVRASATLATQTTNAGDPRYAAMILDASNPTIVKIGQQAGNLAEQNGLNRRPGQPHGSSGPLQQIYDSMSQAVEPVNVPGIGSDEKQAMLGVSQAMFDGIPHASPKSGVVSSAMSMTSGAISHAIAGGNGAALGIGMVGGALQNGRLADANTLVSGVTGGISGLQDKTTADVQAFADATNGVPQSVAAWKGLMGSGPVQTAVARFADRNKGIQGLQATLNKDGIAVGQAVEAWNNLQDPLISQYGKSQDQTGTQSFNKSLSDSLGQFQANSSVQAALGSSNWLSQSFWSDQALKQGTYANTNSPVVNVTKIASIFKNAKGTSKTGILTAGIGHDDTHTRANYVSRFLGGLGIDGTKFSDSFKRMAFSTFGGLGLATYGTNAIIQYEKGDATKGTYNAVAALKDTAEIVGRNMPNSAFSKAVFASLKSDNGVRPPDVNLLTAGWNVVGMGLSGAAVYYDGSGVVSSLQHGDPKGALINGLAAGGDGLSLVNGSIQAASATARVLGFNAFADGAAAASESFGPYAWAGTAAALLASGLDLAHQRELSDQATNKVSSQFLQDGLNVPKANADILGQAATQGTTPVLEALAKREGIDPSMMLVHLGRLTPDQAQQFMDAANGTVLDNQPRSVSKGGAVKSGSVETLAALYNSFR